MRYIKIGLLILYILSPIDAIPDWIPIIGGLDDMIALTYLIYYLLEDKVEQWKLDYSDRPVLYYTYMTIVYSVMIMVPIISILLIIKLISWIIA